MPGCTLLCETQHGYTFPQRHENELAVLTPKTGLSGADPPSLHIQFTLNQSAAVTQISKAAKSDRIA